MDPESFVDFLHRWGEAHPPVMRYRQGEDFAEWQAAFRRQVEALRGPAPSRVEPEPEVLEQTEQNDHTRLTLRIPVSRMASLPAYLLLPHGMRAGEQRPGLIVCHGHATYGIDSVCGVRGAQDPEGARRAYALQAVREGYVVLAPAWWGWPGRDGHLGLVGERDRCNVIQMAAAMYGLSVLDLHVEDGRAAIDVLSDRPEVDPERVGCIGNSYGGRITMWLAVFDRRLRACVPSGCMNHFRERSLKLSSCGIQYLPGLLRYGDVQEVFSLIAPRPMQLQAGEGDQLITPSDRDEIERTVRRAYRRLGAEESYDYVLHPDGHMLRWDLAAPFLERHLQGAQPGAGREASA
jgi:dienelactone hydrolase